jgi:hypothetical protein
MVSVSMALILAVHPFLFVNIVFDTYEHRGLADVVR